MSNTRLSLFFSGTDMTWEDTAVFLQLGAKKRHNLNDPSAKHFYYMVDGPAAAASCEHHPLENIQFAKDEPDFIKASPRKMNNKIGHGTRWARGVGTDPAVEFAYQLIKHCVLTRNIREFDLTGFSRGGNIALLTGALLKKLEKDLLASHLPQTEINKIKVTIYAIDPVAGLSRNRESDRYGELSKFVKTCVIGLATNESAAGFHPRGVLSFNSRYDIKFHPNTQFVALPFPEDHLMAQLWMKDIVKQQLPEHSELLTPCDEHRLIERRLGLDEVKWTDRTDEKRAYRIIHFIKNQEKYLRPLLPKDEKGNIDVKAGIETGFHYLATQHLKLNIGHTSLQNDADSETSDRNYLGRPISGSTPKTKSLQESFARKNNQAKYRSLGFRDRACKEKLPEFTNLLFINLLHEAMFAHEYPKLHYYFLTGKGKPDAMQELDVLGKTNNFFTKFHVQKALDEHVKLKPFDTFEVTNMQSLADIFNLAINKPSVQKENECHVESVTEFGHLTFFYAPEQKHAAHDIQHSKGFSK